MGYSWAMDPSDFDVIFQALEAAQVRYLVVGRVAVVIHGHPRVTADIDLVISLESMNARRAMQARGLLGYRPRAPVLIEQFANAGYRQQWIEDKGLTVFSLGSKEHPTTEISDTHVRAVSAPGVPRSAWSPVLRDSHNETNHDGSRNRTCHNKRRVAVQVYGSWRDGHVPNASLHRA